MEETKYPVTPTKPHSNTNSQSYMESPFNTPHGNRDFAQLVEDSDGNTGRPGNTRSTPRKRENRTKRLCRLVDKLRNENEDLKVRIDELTTASRNLAMEKSCCDQMHEHDILQRIISYAKDHSLYYGNLTMESVHTMLSNIHHKLRASNHPRTASENLEAQIQALRKELAASHAQCQSLGKRKVVSNAKLRESLQDLAISQDEAQSLRTQMQALQKEMLAQLSKVEVISDETFARTSTFLLPL